MTADLEAASLAILENIPITAAMGVRVVKLEPGTGSIEAPRASRRRLSRAGR